jgi:predicted alpha/beta-hydrolase family hydrolase
MVHAIHELRLDGPHDASRTIVLGHGAGDGMDSPFMSFFATGLSERGFRVARFEFPYMADYHKTGRKSPPDRPEVLQATWRQVVEMMESKILVIGGKSMGGRIASLIADEADVDGLICLGYPFHPVGKPNQLHEWRKPSLVCKQGVVCARHEHLQAIKTLTLIVQGERDPFGNRQEVGRYNLSSAIRFQWMEDGDHSFKPRKKSGRTQLQNWQAALGEMEAFITKLDVQ